MSARIVKLQKRAANVRLDMCMDMCTDMPACIVTDMYLDIYVYEHACECTHRDVFRHAHQQMCIGMCLESAYAIGSPIGDAFSI